MKTIITILCLLAIACQANTNHIAIDSNCPIGIFQPGKTIVRVDVPIILEPADKLDVKLLPDRVVITPKAYDINMWSPREYDLCLFVKTNWVKIENGAREVGLIIEETSASIVYSGKTNWFVLESREVGTTRPRKVVNPLLITNMVLTLDAILGGTQTYKDSGPTVTISTNKPQILCGGGSSE